MHNPSEIYCIAEHEGKIFIDQNRVVHTTESSRNDLLKVYVGTESNHVLISHKLSRNMIEFHQGYHKLRVVIQCTLANLI